MHDKHGKLIKVGDRVRVEFTIVQTSATDEYCNVQAVTVDAFYPLYTPTTVWFNAKQVEKVEDQ